MLSPHDLTTERTKVPADHPERARPRVPAADYGLRVSRSPPDVPIDGESGVLDCCGLSGLSGGGGAADGPADAGEGIGRGGGGGAGDADPGAGGAVKPAST